MISFISLFKTINVVTPDTQVLKNFDTIPAVNPSGNKTILVNSASALFINGKPADINGLRKLGNPHFWLVILLVVPFNKIPLISKDIITFIIPFISLLVRVIPEPVTDEILFEVFYQSY